VVGPRDMEGIYFYGKQRERGYAVQERIQRRNRFVTVLSEPARRLWRQCFGSDDKLLLVPGAADREIPPPGLNPYPRDGKLRCVFAGTLYGRYSQPEANRTLVEKVKQLGKRLAGGRARLYLLGTGDRRGLDRAHVTYLGSRQYHRTWDYFYHADVGIVVSAGASCTTTRAPRPIITCAPGCLLSANPVSPTITWCVNRAAARW
jgi:hypothetical protein